MKKLIPSGYQFLASSRIVNFPPSLYGPQNPVSLENLLLITNVSKGQIIYNFADSTATGAVNSTSGFLLGYNTTSMSNNDKLQIYYDVAVQGIVRSTNFNGTSSTLIASGNSDRETFTVYNEGPGALHISAGTGCTTTQYQVRLNPGDYWEAPAGQISVPHAAIFATAGTARVTEVN
jgi:hypothetical protein